MEGLYTFPNLKEKSHNTSDDKIGAIYISNWGLIVDKEIGPLNLIKRNGQREYKSIFYYFTIDIEDNKITIEKDTDGEIKEEKLPPANQEELNLRFWVFADILNIDGTFNPIKSLGPALIEDIIKGKNKCYTAKECIITLNANNLLQLTVVTQEGKQDTIHKQLLWRERDGRIIPENNRLPIVGHRIWTSVSRK